MIVIPMAGRSQRFRDAGYAPPKYMLALHGRTLFHHAVRSFEAYFGTEPFLFVAGDVPGVGRFIDRELAALGVASARTVVLKHPTLGQADTVRLGLLETGADPAAPLTVFNIDTFRPGFRYPDAAWMKGADGYLEVMPGNDPGFSYVLPASEEESGGRVAATAEKLVISDLASTGLYWFRRAGDFMEALARSEAAAPDAPELYVAPVYNALIARDMDVRFHAVPREAVIFCGTPAQYRGLAQQDAAALGFADDAGPAGHADR